MSDELTERDRMPAAWRALRGLVSPKILGIMGLLAAVCLYTALASDNFLKVGNLENIVHRTALFGILSIGVAFVIITGGIDLSIGSVVCLVGVLLPWLLVEHGWSVPAAVGFVLALGGVIGLVHGLLITKLGLQPFVVTLCGLLVYRGVARGLTQDQSQGFGTGYKGLRSLATARFPIFGEGGFELPATTLIFLVIAVAAAVFLNRTVWGRYLLALGRNEQAARYSGIDTGRMKLLAYVISSTLAALGGMLFVLDINAAQPSDFGNFYELYAIAAAVLGGCSLRGGEGSIAGLLVGSALMVVLSNMINLVHPRYQNVEFAIIGGVILAGVIADELVRRAAAGRMSPSDGEPMGGAVAIGEPVSTPAFGLATAVFVVVSSMIGTGVLTTSGFTVVFTGSNQLMLALWVVGGVLALCGALSLAELAAALPESGGDYLFLREAYGPLAGFLSGWVSFLIGFGGPIAASSAASAKYLLVPLRLEGRLGEGAELGLATAVIVGLAVVHCLGRRSTIRAQAGMTVAKLVILVTLAVVGVAAGQGGWANLADRPRVSPGLAVAMASSLVYISYAYTGWNAAAYVAGEVASPRRNVPRAILLGTGLVTGLYLALNLAYALALPAADVRAIAADRGLDAVAPIAQLAAERLFGPRVADPLSLAIGLALLASVSAYVLTGPRVAAAMARAGQFPALASRESRAGAPVTATILQAGWAVVLLWTASFETILLYAGVGLAIFSMLSVAAVVVLRTRRPELARPFRVPWYPVPPVVYLLGTGLLTAAVAWERPVVAAVSLATIAAGVPVHWAWARR